MGSGIKQVYGAGLSTVYTAAEVTNDKEYIKAWVGHQRFDEEGNEYRFVYNATGSALAVNDAVCYDVSDTTFEAAGEIGKAVIDPATADLAFFAGLAMGAIPTLGYGYIQTSGYNDSVLLALDSGGSSAVGQAAYVINAKSGVRPVTAAGTAPTYTAHVKMLEAATAVTTVTDTTTKKGFILGII